MAEPTLTKTRLQEGVWEGWLTDAPGGIEIEATHLDRTLDGVELIAAEGGMHVRVPVPADLLSDGMHTIILTEKASGERLSSFAILAGDALSEDIRAEVDLMRAELDLLKRAIRRDFARSG